MTVETFFANFGHLADAPNGVRKLRELILQLAVQGNLVPQDPEDEPASVLLERILARKQELIKEKKLRNTKIPITYDGNNQVELPPSWALTRLYDVGEIAPRNEAGDKTKASFIPMPLISEFYGVPVQSETRAWGEIKSGFTHFAEGDVCLAKITPCYQNGKSAVMRGLRNGIGAGTTELHVFRAIEETVCPEYVLVFLKSPRFISEGIPRMTGSAGQKRITRDYFAGRPFPLPPLEEQKRIVAKVDQLMALCDELEARQQKQQQGRARLNNAALAALLTAREPDEFTGHWQRISTNFDLLYDHPETIAKLRAAILQLAVQGKLVPQDPSDEVASVLLERIRVEKERLVMTGEIKNPKFLLDQKVVFEWLPYSWKETRLGYITVFGPQNGYSPKPVEHKTNTKSLTLSATTRGTFDSRCFKFVNDPVDENSSLWLVAGDILIQRGNSLDYVGIGAVYQGQPNEFIYPDLMMKVRVSQSVNVGFAHLVINCQSSREFFMENASGTSGSMPKINQAVVNSLPFPLPPLEEQKRIVAKVDQLMALCDELEANLNQAQKRSEKLMEATVQQLLGTSVPQRPHTARALKAPAASKPTRQPRHTYHPAPVTAEPLAAETAADYSGSIPDIILAAMQPGKDYSRADILATTGIREADWMWAIKQLKEQGRVVQQGEKRGARYRVVK